MLEKMFYMIVLKGGYVIFRQYYCVKCYRDPYCGEFFEHIFMVNNV